MIQAERIRPLNGKRSARGEFVLYWMQAAQRAGSNHALEYAAAMANELSRPLVAFFGVTENFPGANARHYGFMLEGLKETEEDLRERDVRLVVRRRSPEVGVEELASRASLVVVDDGYLRIQRKWRRAAAAKILSPLVEVSTNVIVPVETTSPKEEYSAATIRPKIWRHLEKFLVPVRKVPLRKSSLGMDLESLDIRDPGEVLRALSVDRGVPESPDFRGGASEARKRLRDFVRRKLPAYAEDRNDPSLDGLSNLSPYLHFGQISPLEVALEVRKGGPYGRAPFLEELVVRRELSMNFVRYNGCYDRFAGLPAWSRSTLLEHGGDPREFVYTRARLEAAGTHDPFWNAAQNEMVLTGKMHGYMRMYWGKKILEWSASPRQAFRTALALNDKYELDGRDPNGFAGVAWCFGKHDRPWGRRPVFGVVRYMNAAGLRRKFDIDAYVAKVEKLRKKTSRRTSP
jgi:deoxyribodipyrimidine photo-lyase